MVNRLTITMSFLGLMIALNSSVSAQAKCDSIEYVKVGKEVMRLKTVESKEAQIRFQGIPLKKLLSESEFKYSGEHPLTTRSGFLLGWYFKLNDCWMINVYFEKKKLEEGDNVYLNNTNLDSAANRKIRRIEVVKRRL